jgi:hypothetical protein
MTGPALNQGYKFIKDKSKERGRRVHDIKHIDEITWPTTE